MVAKEESRMFSLAFFLADKILKVWGDLIKIIFQEYYNQYSSLLARSPLPSRPVIIDHNILESDNGICPTGILWIREPKNVY